MIWAHPRSRGENVHIQYARRARSGSSPLTRGKHCAAGRKWRQGRLIPAHAGKTQRPGLPARRLRAHPRSRGENRRRLSHVATARGSSPLTRGKLPNSALTNACSGLIPAHAGKTGIGVSHRPRWRAHPRSRGENDRLAKNGVMNAGSSPLTRGKRTFSRPNVTPLWLIPAHAGKTSGVRPSRSIMRAHPRSRGENRGYRAVKEVVTGSSPLTRGKPHGRVPRARPHGLIPAHAGKTSRTGRRRLPTRAHPRSRGENAAEAKRRELTRGSSPLTRGKPLRGLPGSGPEGLIPAHAGKTQGA